ncbi:MAG: DNA methyltransferase [Planctomycetota bacterium]|nr:DNA methyltransferase [Planctomycetota bacterium]
MPRTPDNPHQGRSGNRPKFRPNTPKGTTFKKPPLELFTSTLWEYPSQHYLPTNPDAPTVQGDPNYVGATPSWIIWQLLQRYTKPGDTVLDPMCGSGTTLDVCTDLRRKGIGLDLNPTRPDIQHADARQLPLADRSCDFVFIDPPYSTHVRYSDDPACIGALDAGGRDGGRAYYRSMVNVIAEIDRVLRPGCSMALYVSDSRHEADPRNQRAPGKHPAQRDTRNPIQNHAEFMPIGFELFAILRDRFVPVDIIAVVRRNAKLANSNRREQVRQANTFERGFNYLFIMRKPHAPPHAPQRDTRPPRR